MRLIDTMSGLWMITAEALAQIENAYTVHMLMPRKTDKDLEALYGERNRTAAQAGYEVIDGVAHLSLEGPLMQNPFQAWLFDGTSTVRFREALAEALEDRTVESIQINVDSPGGTVSGTQEAAYAVYEARSQKPVVAVGGMALSAAYYIASAAGKLVLTADTARAGSIGVRTAHMDISRMLDRMGVKITDIWSGSGKNIGSPNQPLSDADRANIQEQIDKIRGIFVGDVAKFRNMDRGAVDALGAHNFIGNEAVAAGLVDGVSIGTAQIIAKPDPDGVSGIKTKSKQEADSMITAEKIKTEHPDIYKAIYDAGAASVSVPDMDKVKADATADGHKQGVDDERARVVAIQENTLTGMESLASEMIKDGTPAADASTKMIQKMKSDGKSYLDQIKEGSADAVPEGEGEDESGKKDFMSMVDAHMQEHNCGRALAIKAVQAAHPKAHQKYLDSLNKHEE